MEFIKSNLWEIKKSSSLRIFGGILGFTHILQYISWKAQGDLPLKFYLGPTSMCWSFFESCQWVRFLSFGLMNFFYNTYLVCGLIGVLFFLFSRFVAAGWFFLFLAFIFKGLFYIQDFRLSSNEGYYLLLLNIMFLFIPNKEKLLRLLMVSFFVSSGLMKLSPEWLTGGWFVIHLNVPVKLGEWLAALSVLFETIGAVTLLFHDARFFWTGFLCLSLYHGFVWYTDTFFGPAVYLTTMMFFAFYDLEQRRIAREYIYQSFIRPEPSRIWPVLVIGGYWLLQAIPLLPMEKHPRLLQAREMLSLHPVAPNEECTQTTLIVFKNRIEEFTIKPHVSRSSGMQCNLYLRFLDVKALCKQYESQPDFITVSSALDVRGLRDKEFNRPFEVYDFCHPDMNYKDLGVHSWNTKNVQ